jgi:hypothetical protein
MRVFLSVTWTYNRCTKSGNRKNATGETGIRQRGMLLQKASALVSKRRKLMYETTLDAFVFNISCEQKLLSVAFLG